MSHSPPLCVSPPHRCNANKQELEQERQRAQQVESELRREQALLQSKVSTLDMELQQAKRLHAMTDEGLQLEVKTLEDRCKRLNALYEAEAALRIQNEEKAKMVLIHEEEVKKLRLQVSLFVVFPLL